MSDFKSKLPDFKEFTSMTSKLYKGIKASVQEIIQDYKRKRAETESNSAEENTGENKVAKPTPPTATPEEKPTVAPKSKNSSKKSNDSL